MPPQAQQPAASPASFITPEYIEDFRRAAHQAVDWVAEYLRDPRRYPVVARIQPGELVDALPATAPEQGEPYERIWQDFEQKILPAVTHWNHPDFFAFFATSSCAPAILGELLCAALNTNGLHWKTSPALAELEQVSLAWLRRWMGLPEEFFGIIYDTASVGSLHAIACAREMVDPEAHTRGSLGNLVLYTSEQSHSSIEKDAIALGIGQNNVRKIATDADFRMRPEALSAAIQQDLAAGRKPFCVVATVGTTATTSIDPVPPIADLCKRHQLWLHVDAAYAGTAAILPEFRHLMAGCERAHSFLVNPMKWMFIPVDLDAYYTRYPDILRRSFSLVPEYLRTAGAAREVNLMDYAIPLGRRFRALKLWFTMRYFGREGIARILRAQLEWAQRLAKLVDADPQFERAAPVPLSVVCFRFRGSDDDNRRIVERVNDSGKAYISQTVLNGRVVLRMAIGNIGTTWQDVAQTWELVRAAAKGD
ncbi:MAG TPA: pyridoxal-dependent decarboxylase [Terriglobales bacterium]|jgi:aromatic-L-amino-acid decarboxylase|nr:pyridoxal-dependent decarboxylase [Terriglobales bacterium]